MFHFSRGGGVQEQGLAQNKCMSARERNMSADKNMAPETTFAPPDGLERRFLGLAHTPPLLSRPFWRTFCQNHGKPWKNREKTIKSTKTQFFMVSWLFGIFSVVEGFHHTLQLGKQLPRCVQCTPVQMRAMQSSDDNIQARCGSICSLLPRSWQHHGHNEVT